MHAFWFRYERAPGRTSHTLAHTNTHKRAQVIFYLRRNKRGRKAAGRPAGRGWSAAPRAARYGRGGPAGGGGGRPAGHRGRQGRLPPVAGRGLRLTPAVGALGLAPTVRVPSG
jgi:hypothetical protein